ncbi:hypothetical protein FNU2_67 [Fusobacterium phage vB_FnuS_FNU2]|nr:hypothetical protein FNU2_67 [Fusobacterium phage vB_FnuS_FNU2]
MATLFFCLTEVYFYVIILLNKIKAGV